MDKFTVVKSGISPEELLYMSTLMLNSVKIFLKNQKEWRRNQKRFYEATKALYYLNADQEILGYNLPVREYLIKNGIGLWKHHDGRTYIYKLSESFLPDRSVALEIMLPLRYNGITIHLDFSHGDPITQKEADEIVKKANS